MLSASTGCENGARTSGQLVLMRWDGSWCCWAAVVWDAVGLSGDGAMVTVTSRDTTASNGWITCDLAATEPGHVDVLQQHLPKTSHLSIKVLIFMAMEWPLDAQL